MSASEWIVSDTGPLISLEKLSNGYTFIRQLYQKILIPPSVLQEVIQGEFASNEAYLHHYRIADLVEVRNISNRRALPEETRLHAGEIEAILLAFELGLPLLIEETVGRRVAQELGIMISGIAGQVVKAVRYKLITPDEAQSKLCELLQAGRINRRICEAITEAIHEA